MSQTNVACPDPKCGADMALASEQDVPDKTGQFLVYACLQCGQKAALVYQAGPGLSQHGQSWIENELKEKGFIFPSDFTGSNGPWDR